MASTILKQLIILSKWDISHNVVEHDAVIKTLKVDKKWIEYLYV
jgi:hypothetical protein